MMKKAPLFLLLLPFFTQLNATTWEIGPSRTYTQPSAVASLAADGDTVNIDAGLYSGDVARWWANRLVLRGVGDGYAHLDAGGNHAEGKAIWVIKGADCVVENIEFSGCTVPDQNGAGIRQEGQNLTLRHCYFHHNEMGILTVNDGVSEYLFEGCEFAFNGFGDGYSHNIYVGHVNKLELRNCYSHDSHIGHLVKSRANINLLYYNRLTGENGDGSYEIDLSNGGIAVLVGNIIEQSPDSENGGMVAFGLEGATNPGNQIVLTHNTLWNRRFDGRFVHVSNAGMLVRMANNIIAGPGTLLAGTPAVLDTVGNLRFSQIAGAQLEAPEDYLFRPLPGSPCIDAGMAIAPLENYILYPQEQYLHPQQSESRTVHGNAADAGAFEYAAPSGVQEAWGGTSAPQIFPNPVLNGRITLHQNHPGRIRLFDAPGRQYGEWQGHSGEQTITLPNVPPGIYFLRSDAFPTAAVIVIP